jgi:competence protein ComEC
MPTSGTVLHGETGEIAVALITGARGGIYEELNQAMRDSGLAHILSISGLHMVQRPRCDPTAAI